MRDFNRIDKVLKELEIYWKQNPDLRLTQLVLNFAPDNGKGSPYYYEDNNLLKDLERANGK